MKKLLATLAAVVSLPLAALATTWYVNGSSGSDYYNSGTSASYPFATIQTAIDNSCDGDTILVAQGTYAPIKTYNKSITIQSTSGATNTVIDGENIKGNRCVDVYCDIGGICTNTIVIGFKLQNGNWDYGYGKGSGGCAYGGTYKSCIMINGVADGGGNASCAVLENCLVKGGQGYNGGNLGGCTVRNCTILDGYAWHNGGAYYDCSVFNSICYNNDSDWRWGSDGGTSYQVSSREEANIYKGDPGFVDAATGDYRLSAGSPCIDAGDNSYVTTSTDLAGNARIANGTVDIGCYEYGSSSGGSLTDGLVAYYPFDGNANDASGNGNNGTVYGAGLTTDRKGNSNSAYYFEYGKYISVADNASLHGLKDFSVSVWVRVDELDGNWVSIICKGTESVMEYGLQVLDKSEYHCCWYDSIMHGTVRAESFLPIGKWVHIAVSRSDGVVSAYLNGEFLGAGVQYSLPSATSGALEIGRDIPGSTEYFYGAMDEVRLYNRALSAAEVKALYDGTVLGSASHTVTFDANGGSVSEGARVVYEGAAVGWLPTPWREGYEFMGWHTGKELASAEVTSSTVVTGDVIWYAVWKLAEYTIWFDANGGYVSTSSYSRGWGMTLGTLPVPTRAGYRFLGWYTDYWGGSQVFNYDTVTADATYYAHWEEITYSVTFDANGGYGSDTYTYYYGNNVGSGPTPWREGYTFLGWFTAKEGGSEVDYWTSVTTDRIYYAHWQLNTYGVWFDANGGSVSTTYFSRTYGAALGTLPMPTRTGYTFLGWYTAYSGGGRVYGSDAVTGDATYYAQWQANTYTVTFNANGGDSSCSYSRTYDSQIGTLPTASRGGYIFKGWFTAASGGVQVSAYTIVTGNVTYYAHWATYAQEISDALGTANVEFETDSSAPWFPDGAAVRSGYIGNNGSSTMSVKLYGGGLLSFRWRVSSEPNYDYLSYSIDGIHGGRISGEQGWTAASILVTGDGWHTVRFTYSKDGGSAYGADCGWVDSLAWSGNAPPVTTCTIAFNANGGSVGTSSRTCNKGAAIGTLPTPTRSGYTFIGWFTAASGGNQVYASTTVTANATYYAHWQSNGGGSGGGTTPVKTCTVTFNGNGGSVDTPSVTRTADSAIGAMPVPEAEGYEFLGWFTAANGGSQVTAATVVTTNVTYYAHWREIVDDNTLWDEDEAFGAEAAAVFNGYLMKDGDVVGLVTVKAGKANARSGAAKLSAKLTKLGETRNITFKGTLNTKAAKADFASGTAVLACAGQPNMTLRLGSNAMWGEFGDSEVFGARDVFAKNPDAAAAAKLAKWQGAYTIALETLDATGDGAGLAWGYSPLAITVGAKGKTTVKGTMVDGSKVSAKTQLICGDGVCCIPVVAQLYSKKGGVAFNIWLSDDGTISIGEMGVWDATMSKTPFKAWLDENSPIAKVASSLPAEMAFMLSGEPEIPGADILYDFLPWEVVVNTAGRWMPPAAGNVKYSKEADDFVDVKDSSNPAGLKLSYVSKLGTFKGSFNIYADIGGRVKKYKANVSGAMVGQRGYGSATVKGVGSWPVLLQ